MGEDEKGRDMSLEREFQLKQEVESLRQQLTTLRELKQAWHDKFWEQSKETNQLRQQLADSQTQLEWVKAAYKELKSRVHGPNEHLVWKEAVEHELIVAGIWRRSHESDPKKAVKDVIDWHVQVARDLQLEN